MLFSQLSSDSSKDSIILQAVTFLAICQILHCKNYGSPSKLYDNIGYHGKSKCLLEYEKLASST